MTIKPRERAAILMSLRSGMVPRIGLQHFAVGRVNELRAITADMDHVADGAAAARFIVGDYGSGKTFFLALARSIAHARGLACVHADLSPERRLHGGEGQARLLYSDLVRSLSTRTKPDGGALSAVLEAFLNESIQAAKRDGTSEKQEIERRLHSLSQEVNGYAFADVIQVYWQAHEADRAEGMQHAERWLRAEYTTKTEARQDLGVRTIIDDASFYDSIKLLARFLRLAGLGGLVATLDELVNLYRINNSQARQSNYEQILRILNDCFQGGAEGIAFLFGSTPESVSNSRRGLYSYQALASRLAENRFAKEGLVDLSSPVINLPSLTPEEVHVLLENLAAVFASGTEKPAPIPPEGLDAYLDHCSRQVGARYFLTPRETVRQFVEFLHVVDQNPGVTWQSLLGGITLAADGPGDSGEDDEFASFKL